MKAIVKPNRQIRNPRQSLWWAYCRKFRIAYLMTDWIWQEKSYDFKMAAEFNPDPE